MRGNMIRCPETSINSQSSPLILLPYLNIPHPTDILFNEFAIRYVRGDTSQRGDGFPDTTWRWGAGALTRDQLSNLVSFMGGYGTGGGLVYIRTRTNRLDANTWQNFSAQMYLPTLTGTDGSPSEQFIDVFTAVSIHFAGLVAL